MSTKEYFSFTRRERTGILTLVIILVIAAVIPHFIPVNKPPVENVPIVRLQPTPLYRDSPTHVNDDSLRPAYYENRYRKPWKENSYPLQYVHEKTYRNNYTGRSWYNNYHRKNYSDSSSQRRSFVHTDRRGIYTNEAAAYFPPRRRQYSPVNINTADTTAFIALPGIGSKLATRIISFRKKLGGFSSIEEIKDVYGLKDSVYQSLVPYLTCDSGYVAKGNLTYTTIR